MVIDRSVGSGVLEFVSRLLICVLIFVIVCWEKFSIML